ncbi:unnamed protein product [Symbiodinium pilosum]|uniref:Uncharacterized protein n=1 Tax=Symbiodinium pilosum TaxID=2952 RepID=A0A812VKZ6_SYMPI|nr:unnamed protein product [Symbiodinium pilosum]
MRINKALTSAAKSRKADSVGKVLRVSAMNLHLMNGVNLATAIHRLARACEGSKPSIEQVTSDSVFQLMLEMAECKAQQEFQLQDTSMPANCCTIITWSCAVLRIFVPSLLGVLARVASRSLTDCQPFEVTNMLWGFAELSKREPATAAGLEAHIQELVDAAAYVMMPRGPASWKVQVLISAFVSLTSLPCAGQTTARLLLLSIAEELAERGAELETANSQPVFAACYALRWSHPKVFEDILATVAPKNSAFISQVFLAGDASAGKGRRVQVMQMHRQPAMAASRFLPNSFSL